MTLLPEDFYRECLDHHRAVSSGPMALSGVVASALPIPYFGDVEGFLASGLRVVTVGLNPSDREFPKGKPRFAIERGLSGPRGLEATLSDYFKVHPYNGWFYSFEAVLAGVGASYYPRGSRFRKAADDVGNVALHLDVCSPIATSPTWSDPSLPSATRAELTLNGNRIFKRLVGLLQPDIVIASVAAHHMVPFHPAFASKTDWTDIIRHELTMGGSALPSPLVVRSFFVEATGSERHQLVALGSAANIPFGRFSTLRKQEAGRAILADWRTRSSNVASLN